MEPGPPEEEERRWWPPSPDELEDDELEDDDFEPYLPPVHSDLRRSFVVGFGFTIGVIAALVCAGWMVVFIFAGILHSLVG